MGRLTRGRVDSGEIFLPLGPIRIRTPSPLWKTWMRVVGKEESTRAQMGWQKVKLWVPPTLPVYSFRLWAGEANSSSCELNTSTSLLRKNKPLDQQHHLLEDRFLIRGTPAPPAGRFISGLNPSEEPAAAAGFQPPAAGTIHIMSNSSWFGINI